MNKLMEKLQQLVHIVYSYLKTEKHNVLYRKAGIENIGTIADDKNKPSKNEVGKCTIFVCSNSKKERDCDRCVYL